MNALGDLQEQIAAGESETLELKRSTGQLNPAGRTGVVAAATSLDSVSPLVACGAANRAPPHSRYRGLRNRKRTLVHAKRRDRAPGRCWRRWDSQVSFFARVVPQRWHEWPMLLATEAPRLWRLDALRAAQSRRARWVAKRVVPSRRESKATRNANRRKRSDFSRLRDNDSLVS